MEIRDYLRILRKRGWIILLVAAIAVGSAFVFSKLQTPVWKASARVSINPARPDFGLTQSAKILLRNYVANMYTTTWAQRVIARLSLDLTPERLKSMTIIASDDSRLIIQVDVKDHDPHQAQSIADEWAQLLVEWREQENAKLRKEDRVYAQRLENATVGLHSPKLKINLVAGGILGLILGGLIVFFLEWLEAGIIRTREDMERFVGLPVLGAIPSEGGS